MNKILWLLVAGLSLTAAFLLITDSEIKIPFINSEASEEEISEANEENNDSDDNVSEKEDSIVKVPTTPANQPKVEPKPAPVVETPAVRDEDGNWIVRYTTYGFDPQTIEIKPGDGVRFLNNNISTMWVKAQAHPTAEYFEYASLNQGRSSYLGESYIFTFTQLGSWGYSNLNKNSHKGVVIVAE